MYLTKEEERILKGEDGEGFQRAMELLVAVGDIYEAEKMIEITSAQISSVAYTNSGETGIRFLEWLVSTGAHFKVLTTLNPHSIEHDRWKEVGFPKEFSLRQIANTKAYRKLGAVGTFTCTPFQVGNIPRFGEHIAWAESSALSYANTVIGARTNRESALGALAAGLIGKSPLYGLHLNENRKGQILINVEANLREHSDYSALGWSVGEKVMSKIPVFTGIPHNVDNYELNTLCAGLAVSGAVGMSHVPGITPEAPTIDSAFGGEKPEETITIEDKELKRVYEDRSTKGVGSKVDLVLLGCPHYGYRQLKKVSELLKGKKVHKDVRLWIATSTPIASAAKRVGWLDTIENTGAEIMCSYCAPVSRAAPFGFETMATNSSKATYYGVGGMGLKDTIFGTTEECINAAIAGKWGERK